MSYDDLWPGIEERLLEKTPSEVDYARAEPRPDTVDQDP